MGALQKSPSGKEIVHQLKRKRQSVAVAESCTGGRLAAAFTEVSGASQVFRGGVVAYSVDAKKKILKVSKKLLDRRGPYDPDVALQMAAGAAKVLEAHWGVGISGVAGPQGGTRQAPVGTVFFGLVGPNVEKTACVRFKGSRAEIQKQAVRFALGFLIEELIST